MFCPLINAVCRNEQFEILKVAAKYFWGLDKYLEKKYSCAFYLDGAGCKLDLLLGCLAKNAIVQCKRDEEEEKRRGAEKRP